MRAGRRTGDRGYVLVNALLIVAALSAVAVGTLRDATDRQAEVVAARAGAQIGQMADAGVEFAAQLLRADLDASGPLDHPGEAWALDAYRVTAGRGTVDITVRDVQGRLNLNLLAGSAHDAAGVILSRLAVSQGLDPTLSPRLMAHFDPIAKADAPQSEADEQEAANVGWFQTGDLTHVLDLPAITGPEIAAQIAVSDQLEALPRMHAVNVNSAPPEVLSAVIGITEAALTPLLVLRGQSPFTDVADFQATVAVLGGADAGAVPQELLTVRSAWFDVRTVTELDGISVTHLTRLYRDANSGAIYRYFQQRIDP